MIYTADFFIVTAPSAVMTNGVLPNVSCSSVGCWSDAMTQEPHHPGQERDDDGHPASAHPARWSINIRNAWHLSLRALQPGLNPFQRRAQLGLTAQHFDQKIQMLDNRAEFPRRYATLAGGQIAFDDSFLPNIQRIFR